jgi:hypothetical protein
MFVTNLKTNQQATTCVTDPIFQRSSQQAEVCRETRMAQDGISSGAVMGNRHGGGVRHATSHR